jgi:hypothetical protein
MDVIKLKGFIEAKITHKNTDRIDVIKFNNSVLTGGKTYLARCLLEEPTKLHVAHMLFGDGGTTNGNPKEVSPFQDKLFGVTRIKKPVIAQVDHEMPTQVIFSVIVTDNEGNDFPLNEMGLELSDGTLFNLSTFADLNKTDQMEIAWSWFVCFV